MAQVSDSTTGLQDAARSLQSQSPRQNLPGASDRGATAENARSDRLDSRQASDSSSQARQTEDRVVLSQQALTENRETRTDGGKRNVDNLRPPSEQRANERGASQRLNDLNRTTSIETRNNEGGVDSFQSAGSSNVQEVSAQTTSTESGRAGAIREQIESSALNNQNAEVPLREFQDQNKNEIRIESKRVSQSVKEIEGQRERTAQANETVFDVPSQRIIQDEKPSLTEQVRSAEQNTRNEQSASGPQAPSPASVQTETGQNVDDLI